MIIQYGNICLNMKFSLFLGDLFAIKRTVAFWPLINAVEDADTVCLRFTCMPC